MKNAKILDCTLRDGGRIINCAFPDAQITEIAQGLCDANVDIVEMGFLRGNCEYKGNSTFFTELDQIGRFIPKNRGNTTFVAFSDYGKQYGMWDFSRIKPYDGTSVDGFRVGFRKEDLDDAIETFHIVKDNGYKLFIQGVESLNYTDLEMLNTIEIINKIKPDAFGIVDTYGAMYKADVLRLFHLVDHNLDDEIGIDFHSHNNMQLSFSFAQEIIEASRGVRQVVIDATLEGLGKGAGNLNLELLADYLNRKHYYNYDLNLILDIIDRYIQWIKKDNTWGYDIPQFMAGIYSSHVNNITYLQDKHRLGTNDIKTILSMIDPALRKRYHYDNIERLYMEYSNRKVNDRDAQTALAKRFSGAPLLVLVPGNTLTTHADVIDDYIKQTNCRILSVNMVDERSDYVFFGNQRKYDRFKKHCKGKTVIVSSNIAGDTDDRVFNYDGLIDRRLQYFDNSTVMLMNLLLKLGKEEFAVAGLDGFAENAQHYVSEDYNISRYEDNYKQVNLDLANFLKDYKKHLQDPKSVKLITPGLFSDIF